MHTMQIVAEFRHVNSSSHCRPRLWVRSAAGAGACVARPPLHASHNKCEVHQELCCTWGWRVIIKERQVSQTEFGWITRILVKKISKKKTGSIWSQFPAHFNRIRRKRKLYKAENIVVKSSSRRVSLALGRRPVQSVAFKCSYHIRKRSLSPTNHHQPTSALEQMHHSMNCAPIIPRICVWILIKCFFF